MLRASRFLPGRFRPPLTVVEAARVEYDIAVARALLATAALLVLFVIRFGEPWAVAALTWTLLAAYLAYSTGLMALVRLTGRVSPVFRRTVHAADLAWATVLSLSVPGIAGAPLVFFLFVLMAAAWRWGLWETLATAGAAVVLLLLAAAIVERTMYAGLLVGIAEPLFVSLTFALVFGILFGYLGERDKQGRAGTALAARMLRRIHVERSLAVTLHATAGELVGLFGARRAILAIENLRTGELYRWDARRQPDGVARGRLADLPASERPVYFFPVAGDTWFGSMGWPARRDAGARVVLSLDDEDAQPHRERVSWARLAEAHPCRSHLGLALEFEGEWAVRVFLLDPGVGLFREAALKLLRTLGQQVGPALYTASLIHRLREQAGAIERTRVANELHDGVIQSITAVDLRLERLRREASGPVAEELERLQALVREEAVTLRELMRQLRPVEVEPARLIEVLADLVEGFGRETGISACFVSNVSRVSLGGSVCRELARIVREALVNVRKHSAARNVLVRLGQDNGCWSVVIDDDGRGFGFAGELTQEQLDDQRRGPMVIKERVRAIGGRLTVRSEPDRGARLQVDLPREGRG